MPAAALEERALVDALTAAAEETGRLRAAAAAALGHRQNARALAEFFVDGLAMAELNGEALGPAAAPAARRVAAAAREGAALATACAAPGWIARMARAEGVREEFARVHSAALAALQGAGLDQPPPEQRSPGCRRLPAADYPDLGKRARKLLKQLGAGSVETGIARLRSDEGARLEFAAAADVPPDAVARDAELNAAVAAGRALAGDGPAREAECRRVFREYVTTSAERITADGFQALAADLGLLDGLPEEGPARAAAARAALVAADADFDGALSFPEFRTFYTAQPATASRAALRAAAGLGAERAVYEAFSRFAAFGASRAADGPASAPPALDASRFAKLVRECGLAGVGFTREHADVVFEKCRPHEGRRLAFDDFVAALAMVAEKRGLPLEAVARAVAARGAPATRATRADAVPLHDDPALYTGVHARGGPSHASTQVDLAAHVSRARPPSGLLLSAARLELTRPESPTLTAKDRGAGAGGSGATTPGRGAPVGGSARSNPSPRLPGSAFGRSVTPRAAALASRQGSAAVSASARTSAATTPAASRGASRAGSASMSRQASLAGLAAATAAAKAEAAEAEAAEAEAAVAAEAAEAEAAAAAEAEAVAAGDAQGSASAASDAGSGSSPNDSPDPPAALPSASPASVAASLEPAASLDAVEADAPPPARADGAVVLA